MGFLTSIISLAIKKGKISETDYRFKVEEYTGINNNQIGLGVSGRVYFLF